MTRKPSPPKTSVPKSRSKPARSGRRPAPGWWCATSSVVLMVLAVSYAAHVRGGLGRWPDSAQDDYGTLAANLHELALYAWVFATIAAAPLWLLLQIAPTTRAGSPRLAAQQVATYAGGWAVLVALGWFDPTHFVDWLLR